ncbi:hypothetical protein B0H16DRAFT_1607743, partial [Mycena metata]
MTSLIRSPHSTLVLSSQTAAHHSHTAFLHTSPPSRLRPVPPAPPSLIVRRLATALSPPQSVNSATPLPFAPSQGRHVRPPFFSPALTTSLPRARREHRPGTKSAQLLLSVDRHAYRRLGTSTSSSRPPSLPPSLSSLLSLPPSRDGVLLVTRGRVVCSRLRAAKSGRLSLSLSPSPPPPSSSRRPPEPSAD